MLYLGITELLVKVQYYHIKYDTTKMPLTLESIRHSRLLFINFNSHDFDYTYLEMKHCSETMDSSSALLTKALNCCDRKVNFGISFNIDK